MVDPPPAVTLTRDAVETLVRQPSTKAPSKQNGAVSTIRSAKTTSPSARLGNSSAGSPIRSWTMVGRDSAVATARFQVSSSTSQPRTMPAPP